MAIFFIFNATNLEFPSENLPVDSGSVKKKIILS